MLKAWGLLAVFLVLAFSGRAWGQDNDGPGPASLEVYVFENGTPVSGVELRFEGKSFGKTGPEGGLLAQVPSGRGQMTLRREGRTVLELDLLTDENEIVLILVTLTPGEDPQISIENSGRRLPLASEREGTESTATSTVSEQPPGALVGTVTSAEDGEPVANARIFFTGTSVETETNEDGRFAVELPATSYSVSVVHPEFASQTLDNIRVIPAREVTLNIELTPAGVKLQDYVVTAPYVEGSIASTLEQQRETSNVADVLGAAQISAAGDSTAADALTRVTGITVEDSKFVLVRGQPFRYTLNLWNGSRLPSPEPLVRVVPLDLFPAGILEGIEVQKSYSVDRPGAFGAGLVNLDTRGVPDQEFLNLSVSTAGNSASTFTEGLTYRGGSTDIFGFDDGTRALPPAVAEATQNGEVSLDSLPDEETTELARTFSNNSEVFDKTLPPDFSVSLVGGKGFDIFSDGRFGFIASGKWGNKWRQQERIQRFFTAQGEGQRTVLDLEESRTDFDSDLGGLVTLEAKWDAFSVESNTFAVHQANQRTQFTTGLSRVSQEVVIEGFELRWIERTLVAQQVNSELDLGFIKAEGHALFAFADRDSPDRREYTYGREPNQDVFFIRGNSGVDRRYNTIRDDVLNLGVDLSTDLLAPEDSWLRVTPKIGANYLRQDRSAVNQNFLFRPLDESGVDRSERNTEILFDPANVGTTLQFRDFSTQAQDDYDGFVDVLGVYAQLDIGLFDLFRLVGGLRYEDSEVEVTLPPPPGFEGEDDVFGFEEEDFLPAAALTWMATEDIQVRATYGRTLSRPNLNELSPSPFFDPDSGEEFIGESTLRPTTIDGWDLRFEWYPSSTESLTFGGFVKDYIDPIEKSFAQRAGTVSVGTFQNADEALVLGVEFGGRFEFGNFVDWFNAPEFFDSIYFIGNVAFLSSTVQLSDQGVNTELERPLEGQADYVLNAQLGYSDENIDLTVAYNQIGTRLHRAGVFGAENVFRQPQPRLDVTFKWRIWDGGTLTLKGSNLTNPTIEYLQQGEVWRSFTRGFSLGAGFRIDFL
ncbi:MAG TPA: TonB-dependent receptor [Myxococcales bacterium LLY-WYZ-16_1]|nr:TonB-dependent receptor [Myxococcales bacterium LLY-WYZ-16_1]